MTAVEGMIEGMMRFFNNWQAVRDGEVVGFNVFVL